MYESNYYWELKNFTQEERKKHETATGLDWVKITKSIWDLGEKNKIFLIIKPPKLKARLDKKAMAERRAKQSGVHRKIITKPKQAMRATLQSVVR
jgi:hypothetical protein